MAGNCLPASDPVLFFSGMIWKIWLRVRLKSGYGIVVMLMRRSSGQIIFDAVKNILGMQIERGANKATDIRADYIKEIQIWLYRYCIREDQHR